MGKNVELHLESDIIDNIVIGYVIPPNHIFGPETNNIPIRQYQLNNLVDEILWAKNVHTVGPNKKKII